MIGHLRPVSKPHPAGSAPWLGRIAAAIVAVAALAAIPASAQQDGGELDVGVRTQLDRNKVLADGRRAHELHAAVEHGKIYGLLLMQPVNSREPLVKPVDKEVILRELTRQLEAHGYHHVEPNHKPEILLTVIYGRSWLPNPYLTDNIDVDNMGPEEKPFVQDSENPFAPKGFVINNPNLAANLSIPSVSIKATKAAYEKLFILVRAWRYPANPKDKPEVLWVTTMLVDDPDHRDLNVLAAKMLEAGAPYFDREIKGEEVDVYKPLPEGHVKLGTPEVVEPKSK